MYCRIAQHTLIILSLCIGTGRTFSQEVSDTQEAPVVLQETPHSTVSAVVDGSLETVPVLPAPLLVPFSVETYQLCCIKKQAEHKWNLFNTVVPLVSLITACCCYTFPYVLNYCTPGLKAALQACKNLVHKTWYAHAFNAVKTATWRDARHALWVTTKTTFWTLPISLCVIGSGVTSCTDIIKTTTYILSGYDFKNYILWEDRAVAPVFIQQQIWHQEIYKRFGNPTVEGTAPIVGKYYIVGEKKQGAGKVIFDPFDPEQVKILLGIHDTIKENLHCKKITIVPLAVE